VERAGGAAPKLKLGVEFEVAAAGTVGNFSALLLSGALLTPKEKVFAGVRDVPVSMGAPKETAAFGMSFFRGSSLVPEPDTSDSAGAGLFSANGLDCTIVEPKLKVGAAEVLPTVPLSAMPLRISADFDGDETASSALLPEV